MLTDKDRRLIRRRCLYPALQNVVLAVCVLSGLYALLLQIILDVGVQSGIRYTVGLYIWAALAGIYFAAGAALLCINKFGYRSLAWQKLLSQANVRGHQPQAAAGLAGLHAAEKLTAPSAESPGPAATVAATIHAARQAQMARQDARAVAERFGVSAPSPQKYVLALILLPVVVITAGYIPGFVQASQTIAAGQQAAAASVYTLRDALETVCQRVRFDDPLEEYQKLDYTVRGYLPEMPCGTSASVSVKVDNSGQIVQVDYTLPVDVQRAPAESLQSILGSAETLHGGVAAAALPAAAPTLLEMPRLPDDLADRLAALSADEGIVDLPSGANCHITYYGGTSEDAACRDLIVVMEP